MQTVHFDFGDNKFLRKVVRLAFPDYNGRKLKVIYGTEALNLHSYWSGGSRTTYAVINMTNMTKVPIPQNGTPFDKNGDMSNVALPANYVVVAHDIVAGEDYGLTIYTPHDAPFLPADDNLSEIGARILIVTMTRKSSYARIKDYRAYTCRQKWGYTQPQIDAARQKLIADGYLSKRRSITNKGKNAIANHPERWV